jgi:putative methionine-R-sulfoxide reductase with GAF domain
VFLLLQAFHGSTACVYTPINKGITEEEDEKEK